MKFAEFAEYLNKIEKIASRLEMTNVLAELFKKAEPSEIDKICYLSLGILAPKYEGIELNLAEKMMLRALAQVLNLPILQIQQKFKEVGDLGEAFFLLNHLKEIRLHASLQINEVYESLIKIAKDSGFGSQERKINKIVELLKNLDCLSVKFIVRIAVQKLRLGFSEMTILDALSWTALGDKSLRPNLEQAFNVRADIGQIAQIFKQAGIAAIDKVIPQIGKPIRPAKATPLLDKQEILDKMEGRAFLEPKYDGFRVQLHFDKQQKNENQEESLALFAKEEKAFVRIFSRNLDNITHMFPELVEACQKLPVESVILDGEAVAIDPKTGKLLDFQETVKRKRKHNVQKVSEDIPLKAFIFDCLYLNGENLLTKSFSQRRDILNKLFVNFQNPHMEETVQQKVDNVVDLENFFQQVAGKGLEGLMAKKIDAVYKAGARDFTWVKYKVGMQQEMADTVDAVVMGYFKGQGKWAKFGLGKVLVGILDKEKIIAVSKLGSGLSEEKIIEMKKQCDRWQTAEMPVNYQVDKNLFPDVWVAPKIVIEIRADSISKSPLYQAGLSLRFPRFIKFRPDKNLEDATNLQQLQNMSL
ncbi:ATP-dependent DNA ligase [Candidatus Beckwithbacteria bacterium]|nr:ATP-dependent DNA ligase [Candidatus Beckwithbacteria bacterium]